MKDPVVESMPYEVKEWFARAVVGMIWADGHIDKAEIEYLKEVIGFIGDQKLVQSMMKMVKGNQVPPLTPIKVENQQAVSILKHLTSISIVDEELAPEEEQYLKHAASLLKLPNEISEKFLGLAKKRLKNDRLKAQLIVGGDTIDVLCFGGSETECLFFSNRKINPKGRITIKLIRSEKGRQEAGIYQPIAAEAVWCRAVKSPLGNFIVKASFKHILREDHGSDLLVPKTGIEIKPQPLIPANSSLRGFMVQCKVCGKRNIPFRQLKTKCVNTKNNMFGIPVYVNAVSGKVFCDFNLIQVTVCPQCYFSSNQRTCFQRQDKDPEVASFDIKLFSGGWQQTIAERGKLVGDNKEWLTAEERTPEQAIVSYRLAINTHDQLATICDIRDQVEHQRKSISFLLTQAELLMNKNSRELAEKNLKIAEMRLNSIFPNLEKEGGIRAAFLLIMIKIYFKKHEEIGQYLNFLRNYPQINPIAPNSPEHRALSSVTRLTTDAWQSRDEYSREKLKSFHL
ncbi:TerB family tellurite resistance protein [bacterium]|nr:TerB family tellurite resistance protein [bacterium]